MKWNRGKLMGIAKFSSEIAEVPSEIAQFPESIAEKLYEIAEFSKGLREFRCRSRNFQRALRKKCMRSRNSRRDRGNSMQIAQFPESIAEKLYEIAEIFEIGRAHV